MTSRPVAGAHGADRGLDARVRLTRGRFTLDEAVALSLVLLAVCVVVLVALRGHWLTATAATRL